jgi:hypothetical protein
LAAAGGWIGNSVEEKQQILLLIPALPLCLLFGVIVFLEPPEELRLTN